MALNWMSGVSVESWIELSEDVETRIEVDPDGDCATLFFGAGHDLVLHLGRENLAQLAALTNRALAELRQPAG